MGFFQRKFKKLLPLIVATTCLILFSAPALATGQFGQLFKVSKTDESLTLLQFLFGSVNGILSKPGSATEFLGPLFRYFNETVLFLAVIVIMYTVVMSIINTAHQGEFLGKKLDSIWVPVRSVLGVLLVIPTSSGYSLIQIFLMWIVLQGVGAADSLWTHVVTALSQYNQSLPIGTMTQERATQVTNQIMAQEICLYSAYKEYGGITQDNIKGNELTVDNTHASFDGISFITQDATYDLYSGYNFQCAFKTSGKTPIKPDCKLPPDYSNDANLISANCGTIKWLLDSLASPNLPKDVLVQIVYQTTIPSIIDALYPSAQNYVLNGTSINSDTMNTAAKTLKDAVDNTIGSNTDPNSNKTAINALIQPAIDNGWVVAGSYYYLIAQITNGLNADSNLNNLNTQVGSGNDSADVGNNALSAYQNGGKSGLTVLGTSTFIGPALRLAVIILTGSANNTDFINGKMSNIDPIIALQILGTRMVTIIEIIWQVALLLILVFALVSHLCQAVNPLSGVFDAIMRLVIFPVMLGLGLLFVSGITMQVYIPMIPYIIFTFGVVGWLIAVIETIMAGPLIALGIAHPEGHEVYGRAEPALMLVVNVFLRPTFMIFGLIAGMLISIASVKILNFTFAFITNSTLIGSTGADEVQTIFYLMIYLSMVITIINKSYALITTLGDSVLRFIGNQSQLGSEQGKGEELVKQSFGGAASTGGDAGQKVTGGASSGYGGVKDKIAQNKAAADKSAESNKPEGGSKPADAGKTGSGGTGGGGGGTGGGTGGARQRSPGGGGGP